MAAALPATMMAIAAPRPGGPEALAVETRPLPAIEAEDILVRVHAAGVNRPDVMQRQGLYAPPPGASDILGLEVAGEVVARGAKVTRFALGAPVTALVPGGGYAEYCRVHHSNALPVPDALTMVEAAGLPETFFTVWSNVFDRAGLAAGETILIHGGGSGIGTTAIQLAKAFGARVLVTTGSADKCTACRALGADVAIDYTQGDFVSRVGQDTNGRGADVILDMVGGDYVGRNLAAAAPDGRIVQIATLRGARPEIDLRLMMTKRLTYTGSTLRPRPIAFKAAIAAALEEKVWPLLAGRRVKPVIDSTFPLTHASQAHERIETAAHFGKIVLTAIP